MIEIVPENNTMPTPPQLGATLPDLELFQADGTSIHLRECFRDRPMMLVIFLRHLA